jgi:hypothetical protein
MKKIFSIVGVWAMLVMPMLAGTALAQAADASAATASTATGPQKKAVAKKAVKKAVKKTAKPVFVPGSAETVAQRNARLKRECKGAVNAGACLGYTR